jgi:phage FluMu protein Com
MRAELAAREAVCPKCATYGKLDLAADEPQQERMEVRCQRCRNVWSMSDAGDE